MRYILFLKENIAVARSIFSDKSNIELHDYDTYEEITEKDYNLIELPAINVEGKWVKSDRFPSIEYPKSDPEDAPVSDIDQMRADIDYIAIMTGVDL